ncbi:MAG: guanylate kinase [Erysipelotrichaceae bacterium]|nr:guanylate kinase [Erysipelotrichaceae bacterium]
MKKGMLIIYSGPSGVGKGTIMGKLMPMEDLRLVSSVSMTTRKPREGEVEGVNYFYVTKKRFKEAIRNDELLEYAEYVKNYYGTPREYVEKQLKKGNNVVLEIEVQGARQVMEKMKDHVSIFITPPSMEELERRILGRKSETPETLALRIETAKKEMEQTGIYDYVVCNDDLDVAVEEVRQIILKEMEKREEKPE